MKITFLTAFILLVTYFLFLEFGPRPRQIITQSQWQDNRLLIERYLYRETKPKVVFIGTSYTGRLDFPQDDGCVYSFAFSGESALTGLHAILQSDRNPRRIFIESNFADNNVINYKLIDYSKYFTRFGPVLYTENAPANLFLSFYYQWSGGPPERTADANFFRMLLGIRKQTFANPPDQLLLDKNLEVYREVITALEDRGIQIGFYEMPVYPELEASPRAVTIRQSVISHFPHNTYLHYEQLADGVDIQTSDGTHLVHDAALGVRKNLEPFYKDACTSP